MKIYNYVVLTTLLLCLMYVAGFDTAVSYIFSKFGINDIANYNNSSFFLTLGIMFGIATAGSAIIGSFFNISPIFAIKSFYVMTPLLLLLGDFVGILNKFGELGVSWIYYGIFVIMIPLIVSYAIAIIEFWESRD